MHDFDALKRIGGNRRYEPHGHQARITRREIGQRVATARLDFAGVPADHKVASDGGLIYAEITYDGINSSAVAGGTAEYLFYLTNNIASR